MLVVIAIVLILASLTALAVSSMADSDRIRSSARQVQSMLLGAKERATKAKTSVGVRFLLDPDRPWLSNSMVYVTSSDPFPTITGTSKLTIGYTDLDNNGSPDDDPMQNGMPDQITNATYNGQAYPSYNEGDAVALRISPNSPQGDWLNLYNQGLLGAYVRINIQNSTGQWKTYVANTMRISQNILTLTTPYPDPPTINFTSATTAPTTDYAFGSKPAGLAATPTEFDYSLELLPSVQPGQEPVQLSSGIYIDLTRSQVPPYWFHWGSFSAAPGPAQGWNSNPPIRAADPNNPGNSIYYESQMNMDVMFSPRGPVSQGAVVASGLVNLYLAESEDIDRDDFSSTYLIAGTTAAPVYVPSGTKLVATIFPSTGNVGTYPANLTDTNNDNIPDDLFYYSKLGAAANR
jgi:hypothetical protein